MLGFTRKRFFLTLLLSIIIWFISAIIQAFVTAPKYIGTFSRGCQVTGYPIDICDFNFPNVSPAVVIGINIFIWFWVIHLFWGWFDKRRS
ncbi:MAG: hypothetical protein US86_C0001G0246 [Candidatus Daviesbacteria bacterium GW2011_GWA2_38_24]|uniref:Uncharacterized protein n=1 Tax=Candidatus Daviesbacteria bacterium GW2011_GWA2_38_24 TaxID=1618422 RepID=A0A0G0M0Y9_9BACT|nr:MAG: hypothetical protein US86_C0001G0246 [Candidatus Daviesbacteria bacterium GW2011_GWA2_38_24]KKQ79673.1 MAG: hypothetical protein UT01_C0031G0010 [Candidatus Daviesbacteria bacterium GW2011_GWA1_38_7]OGE24704.1 MAG: hypothetical protein A2688_01695 [Candidatus Daviesbacteria bacterium RIFCSPHIGHO2_01_FULL_38_8]